MPRLPRRTTRVCCGFTFLLLPLSARRISEAVRAHTAGMSLLLRPRASLLSWFQRRRTPRLVKDLVETHTHPHRVPFVGCWLRLM